ncbi:2Fe-2S iron-sulfur cluster-binding protein [Alteromonas sp. ASW11-19]|uniref:2Fe-2S iron-sulfur cluster-binding protein n=1 Tax=Alteromonas salexigens TaxID=2982530 RepID=A0ABT2VTL2_9ALTE|nr:2Fe-2S iron-sulfur cluster-binding protein [Alteromonas salexigens]MCU7555581.1 2Fe-2S iron-sulfur cluster-binding protein [Alteromonas salexigens]
MSLFKVSKTAHKWLSLVVGIQLLVWLGTGVYFNLMDHHKAMGHEFRAHSHQETKAGNLNIVPVSSIASAPPISVQMLWILNHPYYHFVYEKGQHSYQKRNSALFDAVSGERAQLTAAQALVLAQQSYSGPGQLQKAQLVAPPFDDYVTQQNPMWQIDVTDDNSTRIYLDGVTGRVIRHTNDDVRLKNLMMKLHFMDYGNEGGFNHGLIILFAVFTLFLSVTGVLWLVQQWQSGLLKINWRTRYKPVTVTFSDDGSRSDISAKESASVLDELANSEIYLPTTCGGGGTCGKCLFKSDVTLPTTSAEKEQLSERQLKQGYRLGCQHKVSEISTIEVASNRCVDSCDLVVTESKFLTPFIKEVTFKEKSGRKLAFKAGAYMEFDVPAGVNNLCPVDLPAKFKPYWTDFSQGEFSHSGATRHYSIANFDQESEELTFNIRWQTSAGNYAAGIGSSYLGSLKTGEEIKARGPYCDFYASNNSHRERIFVGAGSGLAPLRSIIFEQLKKYNASGEMVLVYGARTEDDLLYYDELKTLEAQFENFRYIPTLSAPSDSWRGESGYVQKVLSTLLNERGEPWSAEYYLCGPAAMMEEVEKIILANGVPADLIFKDKFSR